MGSKTAKSNIFMRSGTRGELRKPSPFEHWTEREIDESAFKDACVAENGARRLRDFGGRKRRSGHLIQQRLKKVMIAPVNQDNVDRSIAQVLDQVQTSETTTDNHHALPLRGRYGGLDRWSHLRTFV
jgi:hypothetical protein